MPHEASGKGRILGIASTEEPKVDYYSASVPLLSLQPPAPLPFGAADADLTALQMAIMGVLQPKSESRTTSRRSRGRCCSSDRGGSVSGRELRS